MPELWSQIMAGPINLTVPQFCLELNCGKTKAYELIATGEVEAIKLGKKTLIPRTEVERLQARLPRIRSRSPVPAPRADTERDLYADQFGTSSTK
jgi:excisionase family DNA binding protein